MMADRRHFAGFLEPRKLQETKEEYGFGDTLAVEKFVLDCEIAYQMLDVLPDFSIKGGLAVPFHLKDDRFRRLSEDVDMVTSSPEKDVEEAVGRMAAKCDWLNVGDPHVPNNARRDKDLPLLTYFCKYRSAVAPGGPSDIKLEIFYGNDTEYATHRTDPAARIFGMPIDFGLRIFGREELIGDKLSTLPLETIGVGERLTDMPKHIYDVATLLRAGCEDTAITDVASGFERACRVENSYFVDRNPPTHDEILRDLTYSIRKTLDKSSPNRLDGSYKGRLGLFKRNLGAGYADRDHVTDVMLVWTVAEMVRVMSEGGRARDMSERLVRILLELRGLTEQGGGDQGRRRRILLGKHRNDAVRYGMVKNMGYEHALLYDGLVELQSEP